MNDDRGFSGSDSPPDGRLDALAECFALKDERRTGWELRAVERPETVAGHAWGVALLCFVFAADARAEFAARGESLDVDRAIRLAVVHDLAEARTGDLPTRADSEAETSDPDQKEAAERDAMDRFEPLGDAVREAWEEYETRETPAAIFVKEMDLVDLCLQALVYERQARYDPEDEDAAAAFRSYDALDEFFATAEPRLRTDLGRSLVTEIRAAYEAAKSDPR